MSELAKINVHRPNDGESLTEYAERLQAEGHFGPLEGESAESYKSRLEALRHSGAMIKADIESESEYELRLFGRPLTAEEIEETVPIIAGFVKARRGDEAATTVTSAMQEEIERRRSEANT